MQKIRIENIGKTARMLFGMEELGHHRNPNSTVKHSLKPDLSLNLAHNYHVRVTPQKKTTMYV